MKYRQLHTLYHSISTLLPTAYAQRNSQGWKESFIEKSRKQVKRQCYWITYKITIILWAYEHRRGMKRKTRYPEPMLNPWTPKLQKINKKDLLNATFHVPFIPSNDSCLVRQSPCVGFGKVHLSIIRPRFATCIPLSLAPGCLDKYGLRITAADIRSYSVV